MNSAIETLMGQVAAADAAVRRITAQMDAELKRVRDKYADALDAETAKREAAEGELASWAELNREAFGNKRSMQLTHGVMGWRLGTPALKLRPRVKADMALDLVKNRMPEFIRTKTEVNKDAILGAVSTGALAREALAELGYQVTQTERFYVEPKTEMQE